MKAEGRNYAPAKTTTDEWEAVMKAEGRNYAPAKTTTDEWEAVMEREARNYAPAKTTTDEWEAVMEAEGRNYAPVENLQPRNPRVIPRSALHYRLPSTRNSGLRPPLPPPVFNSSLLTQKNLPPN